MRQYAMHEPWLYVSESADVRDALKGYAEKRVAFANAKKVFCLDFEWGVPKVWPVSG